MCKLIQTIISKTKTVYIIILISLFNLGNLQAQDWENLEKYRIANINIDSTNPHKNRVVFMGNSIIESWGVLMPEFFNNSNYINRGISGQTTPQMLIRFQQDVVNLNPKVVVILAGTNDIAGNTGKSTLKMILDNIFAMCQIASENNIKVVMSSVLPVLDYPWKMGLEPSQKIIALNIIIKEYAIDNGYIYLDYFSVLVDEHNGLPKKYSSDGVHPNFEGYKIMKPLADDAILKALKN